MKRLFISIIKTMCGHGVNQSCVFKGRENIQQKYEMFEFGSTSQSWDDVLSTASETFKFYMIMLCCSNNINIYKREFKIISLPCTFC